MIAVIQCAGRKRPDAGRLLSATGKPLVFVAAPAAAPADASHVYARPDDPSDAGPSWRQVLVNYNNESAKDNPLGLFPAYRLYKDKSYEGLVDRLGVDKVYILSAGWGLIRSDFLTPYYDITFAYTKKRDAYKRRRPKDRYLDFNMLPPSTEEELLFFSGKSYLPLFCALTAEIGAKRTVFYNSKRIPRAPGCTLKRFETTTQTNWHYESVAAFLDGTLR